jgi:hypothetical protein
LAWNLLACHQLPRAQNYFTFLCTNNNTSGGSKAMASYWEVDQYEARRDARAGAGGKKNAHAVLHHCIVTKHRTRDHTWLPAKLAPSLPRAPELGQGAASPVPRRRPLRLYPSPNLPTGSPTSSAASSTPPRPPYTPSQAPPPPRRSVRTVSVAVTLAV